MSSELWTLLQTQAFEADHAYDTRSLHQLDDRTAWLQRYRGNSITLVNRASSSDPTSWSLERPYASAKPASIISVPYYVNPGLERLEFGIYYRVSDHFYDAGTDARHSPEHVKLTARLLGNNGTGPIELLPVWQDTDPDDTPPDWGYAEFELELGDWIFNADNGLWSHLVFGLQSSRYYDGSADLSGVTENSTTTSTTPARIISDSDASFYAESSAPPYGASHGANETTCSVFRDNNGLIGVFDHLKRRRGDNDTMWVWPRTVPTDGLPNGSYKASLAYLQWRSLTITEVYASDTGVDAADKKVAAATTGKVPARTARRLNEVNNRRQYVAGFPTGELPDTASQWDISGYMMRFPFALGESGEQTLFEQVGDVAGSVTEVEFRPVLSPVYYATAIKTDKSYTELQDASVEAYLRITASVEQLDALGAWTEVGSSTIEHRTRFVFTDTSGNHHHLLATEKQFDITYSPTGDGFVYREGFLDLDTDLGPLADPLNNPSIVVDVSTMDTFRPCRCVMTVEIIDPEDGDFPGRFLDDELSALVSQQDGLPVPSRMRAILLGMSVWSV